MGRCHRKVCKKYKQGDLILNDSPKVSVIIATHNHAHFLLECLGSVKSQTYRNYEVIVVNNGSTDNTKQVVRDLAWDELRYYYQNDTGSVAGPRNAGIKLAKGEYVAFLDSDDLWYEKKLEKVMGILEKNPDIDILSHDLYLVRPGKQKKILRSGPLKKDMFKSLLIKNSVFGSATVVKRTVMVEIGGFDESKNCIHVEDGELWLKLAQLGKKFYFINEPLGEYRVHGSNLSLDFETVLFNEKTTIDKYFKNLKNYFPLYVKLLYLNRLCTIYFNLGIQYFFRRKIAKGLKNTAKAFFLNPVIFFYRIFVLFRRRKELV